jgi:hypothetical protein
MEANLIMAMGVFVFGQIVTAAGIYSAIRSDLREYQVRIGMLEKHLDNRIHVCKT